MAGGRDDENKMYGCMVLPPDLHRVHTPEDDVEARVAKATARNTWRRSWQRALQPLRRRA